MVNVRSTARFLGRHFFIIGGLFSLLLGTIDCINNLNAIQGKTVTTRAKIVSCKISQVDLNGNSGYYPYCTPTIRFKTNTGQEIDEVISLSGFEGLVIGKGQTITINYPPHQPKQALITSIELWYGSIYSGGFGLLLSIIGIIVESRRLKKKKQSSRFV